MISVCTQATGGPGLSMLVVGTRGLGVLAGLLLGSVSRRLLFSVQRPLVLVPLRTAPLGDHPRIVVAIDGAPVGDRVLRWAAELCAAIDGSTKVLRCSEPGAEGPAGYVAEYDERVLERMEEQAADFRSRGVDYTLNVSNDDARFVILDTAVKEHADLIVDWWTQGSLVPLDPPGF